METRMIHGQLSIKVCRSCRSLLGRSTARRSLSSTACQRADETSSTPSRTPASPIPSQSSRLLDVLDNSEAAARSFRRPKRLGMFDNSSSSGGSNSNGPPRTNSRQPRPPSQPKQPISLSEVVRTGIDPFASRPRPSASDFSNSLSASIYKPDPFTLSIYSHKHNTHMTLTGPFPPKSQLQGQFDKRKAISVSCGNIGFRKAARGTFDAGFQLAAFMLGAITERNLLPLIESRGLEVQFRGFGQGREAVEKALLGTEGRHLRKSVVRVMDTTRLKFGGTRSPNPRRL